jgi:Fe-S oxidoreductase
MVWPDTFNNYFQPEVAKAAVEVLEDAGYEVEVPRESVCCGRPLYDYGMLDLARSTLLDTIAKLRPQLRDGTPIVGLEPSCVSVFRDEMPDLLWGNEDARRLSGQVFLFSEFLKKKATGYRAPVWKRRAMVQGHCHHKAIFKMNDEEAVLKEIGLDYQMLDAGCCGMAGAFGYEEGDHYDVSIACGERVLIPAVRNAPDDTLIIADGFSCREQIAQTTDRRAFHLAEVMRMATGAAAPPARQTMPVLTKIKWTAIGAAAIATLGCLCWRRR